MENLIGDNAITEQDIMLLNPDGIKQARRHLIITRQRLGKPSWNSRLTVKEYCDYWGISYELVISIINPYRKPLSKRCKKVQKGAG